MACRMTAFTVQREDVACFHFNAILCRVSNGTESASCTEKITIATTKRSHLNRHRIRRSVTFCRWAKTCLVIVQMCDLLCSCVRRGGMCCRTTPHAVVHQSWLLCEISLPAATQFWPSHRLEIPPRTEPQPPAIVFRQDLPGGAEVVGVNSSGLPAADMRLIL
jgi:hypothetical protein